MKLRCLSDLNEKSTSNHKTFAFKSNVEKKILIISEKLNQQRRKTEIDYESVTLKI